MPRKKEQQENMQQENMQQENMQQEKKLDLELEEKKVEETILHPLIRGGICDFCGISAKDCPHYKKVFSEGRFRCLCGGSNVPSTFNQSIYMWVNEKVGFICNSDGCRRIANSMGLASSKEVFDFYRL